ncbi:hypothetical protein Acjp253 [Acinetobacter phage 133]|uniref:Uncharacterized protein n=1 Tax=Acinetobacter phage 133 TaxID=2919552 RepID=D9I6I7_9CAUD|nr:hypothetical protein Acjp253 [Acinetobacter phage 133]ADJ19568.1 hypothetical protein Acjp253 [Acinetobacter phage 133]
MKNKVIMMLLLASYAIVISLMPIIRTEFGDSAYVLSMLVSSVCVFFILCLTKEDKKIGK